MSLQDLIMLNQKCEELEIEIEKLKADLKREQDLIDKFIVTTDNLLTHSNEDYEWQTEQLIKLARLTQQQRREG